MKISVAVHDDRAWEETLYMLETLLGRTGLPFHFGTPGGDEAVSPSLWLHYGMPGGRGWAGVAIPADDPWQWKAAEPRHASLNGLPVLHLGDKESSLFQGSGKQVCLTFDPIRGAFWLLSRWEEVGTTSQDAFGRFDCSTSWLVRHGLSEVPVVDLFAQHMVQVLTTAAMDAGLPLLRKLPWPYGKEYAVVLSHDVDDAGRFTPRQGLRMLGPAIAQGSLRGVARGVYYGIAGLSHWLRRQPDPYWNFERVMALEADAGFRSTFFFVPKASSVRRDPAYEVDTPQLRDLLGRLREGGWEVGVHGSFDSFLDPGALWSQRQKLERVSGGRVLGVRQHYLRFQVPHTFRAQEKAGFVYDATVGYRSRVGFRAGAAFPYRLFDSQGGRRLNLLELPLAVMDGALFWQLGLAPTEATARTLALLETVRSVQGLAVLLWHQRVWYQKRYPGWSEVYCQVLEFLRDENRAWVAPAGQVADWWLAREAVELLAASVKGHEYRWRFNAGRQVEGLTLMLTTGSAGRTAVTGADARIETVEGGFQVEIQRLATGQSFEIVWKAEAL